MPASLTYDDPGRLYDGAEVLAPLSPGMYDSGSYDAGTFEGGTLDEGEVVEPISAEQMNVWVTRSDGRQQKTVPCPCCVGGGGSRRGFSAGIPMPNCGCMGCDCCPGVCFWATDWHRAWDASTPQYQPNPGPYLATLASYSATYNPDGNLPLWLYFGDVAGVINLCQLGGLLDIDCEFTTYRIVAGTARWEWATGFVEIEFTYPTTGLFVQWGCPNDEGAFAAGYIDPTFAVLGSSPDFVSFDWTTITIGTGVITPDIGLAPNNFTTDGVGLDTSSCEFTVPLDNAVPIPYPPINLIPLYL